MTETASEATDAEVAAALGVGDAEEQDQQDEGSEDQESEEQEVGAELAELRKELAKLRREAAERRVRDRQAKAVVKVEDSSEVEAAKEAGREEARAEAGIELATDAVRAALTGIIPDDDLDDFVDELNISRVTTDDHKPDREAIASLKARQSKLTGARKNTAKVNHGRSGNGSSTKSTKQQFEETMSGLLNAH